MDDLKTNSSFRELSHEETEAVAGGFHFLNGVIREVQSVANVALELGSSIADATDSVLGLFTRFARPGGSNGSGLLGGLFGRRR